MKVVLSRRVKAELASHFEYGVGEFGRPVAERTFARVTHMIERVLPAHPESGTYSADRDIFERVVPNTPFVIFYRLHSNPRGDRHITVTAFFNFSQDRDSFEG